MKKENNKPDDVSQDSKKISEQEIQRKLYGDYKVSATNEISSKDKSKEKDFQKKLYGGSDLKEKEKEKETDLFSGKKEHLDANLLSEIGELKELIGSLEKKLKKSEEQKEHFKMRLAQKQKVVTGKQGILDVIYNKMPEKFIIFVTVGIILLLLLLVLNLKPKNPETVSSEKTPETVSRVGQPEPSAKPARVKKQPVFKQTAQKRFTIQVAEYADEPAAMRFVEKLRNDGFQVNLATIYRSNDKTKPYFKINVGGFDQYNEAKKYNQVFRKKTGINDSFIKERK